MEIKDGDIVEIGGNSLLLWWGNILEKISNYYKRRSEILKKRGSKTIISNPSCKFINHCTIIFSFTVNMNEKYQLIHQGRFTEKYKWWIKQKEDYEKKMVEYEGLLKDWESKEVNERNSAPQKPEMEEYPLTVEEMFHTILSKQKMWYKKG